MEVVSGLGTVSVFLTMGSSRDEIPAFKSQRPAGGCRSLSGLHLRLTRWRAILRLSIDGLYDDSRSHRATSGSIFGNRKAHVRKSLTVAPLVVLMGKTYEDPKLDVCPVLSFHKLPFNEFCARFKAGDCSLRWPFGSARSCCVRRRLPSYGGMVECSTHRPRQRPHG